MLGAVARRQRNHQYAIIIVCLGTAAALILALWWPFASTSSSPAAQESSCDQDLRTLPRSISVSTAEAKRPLIYKVVSTDTTPGDNTAVSHGIFQNGWMQQVFIATQNRAIAVSAIIDAAVPSGVQLPILFQILDMQGRAVAHALGRYNGSTNNGDFSQQFAEPAHLIPGMLYVLRVQNESAQLIHIYAHVFDSGQSVPYPIPGCDFNSMDSPNEKKLDRDQVLSGFILGAQES
jgi:hypothetical protein